MIRLREIYSETGLIDKVTFKDGLNIVLGKYSDVNRELNGIGKSTLVRLIDYCLLSSSAKNKFLNVKKLPFLDRHSIALKLEIDGEIYIIKRYFSFPNKVCFGKDNNLSEFSAHELKEVLGNIFFKPYNSSYYENKWFRSLIKFFIKDDLDHHERKIPYNFVYGGIRKNLIIVYNLYLFGLPNKNLYQFEIYKREIEELAKIKNKLIESIESEFKKNIEELRGELAELEESIEEFRMILEEYNFIETFEDLEERLIEITHQISNKLKKIQELKQKLSYILESYKVNIEIDTSEAVKYYNILKREIGFFLKKKLEDIISFRQAVAENRKKYLADKEREIKAELDKTWKEYFALEKERQKIYKILDSKDRFGIIKNMYENLIQKMAKYQRIKEAIIEIDKVDSDIRVKEKYIENLYYTIVDEIERYKSHINKINTNFRYIARKCTATSEGSYLYIEATNNRRCPIDIKIDIPKSLSHGRNQLKILLYDLCIFKEIIQNKKPMPFFLIHDGVFHGIDAKTKIRTLNFIYELMNNSQYAQYIVTFNEDEIYEIYDGEKLKFDYRDHIIAIYEDNIESTIFKREF